MSIQWLDSLTRFYQKGRAFVVITIVEVKGSTPRSLGTKMLISTQETWGTIGGGNLEYQAIASAHDGLAQVAENKPHDPTPLIAYPLGSKLGQCCGGYVRCLFEYVPDTLFGAPKTPEWIRQAHSALKDHQPCTLLTEIVSGNAKKSLLTTATPFQFEATASAITLKEVIEPSRFQITLFGAGHVGKALVHILHPLNCHIRWCDEREAQFPEYSASTVEKICHDAMDDEIRLAPDNSYFLVMTHSHALDYLLTKTILQHAHRTEKGVRFCGLIGSETKRNKFIHRLQQQGVSDHALSYLTCPIGLNTIHDKTPQAIAIAVAAQLMAIHDQTQEV